MIDRPDIVAVMVGVAVEGPYSYRVPEGMTVERGSIVAVPLGPRLILGVVWGPPKDLIAHIGSWLAEAGAVLEQIRAGTYRPEEIDIDAMNKRFYEALHDVPFPVVKVQAIAARNQMLRAWATLPEASEEADRWIRKSGPEHYAEHLPRLREWVGELQARPPSA